MTFPIRGILTLTRRLMGGGWLPLVLVTLLYLLPVWAVQYGQSFVMHSALRDVFFSAQGLGPAAWIFIAISWFLRGFHMSAVTEIALRTAASKPIRPGRLLLTATVNALPVLLLQTLLELIVAVGGVLLVVPGLFLGAAFSVVVPTYICEGKNIFEALRQSFKLTQHRQLPIAALWLAIFVVYGLATGSLYAVGTTMEAAVHWILPSLSLPFIPRPDPSSPFFSSPLGLLLGSVGRQVACVSLMVLNVSIYLGLRFHKTDSADNEVAAIFE